MSTFTQNSKTRIRIDVNVQATEWCPQVVKPDGKIRSVSERNASSIFDEDWIIKDGRIVRAR